MSVIQVNAYQCDRCGYIWYPRSRMAVEGEPELPKTCPHCRSPYWNTPRKNKRPEPREADTD
jgi:hypothetical protein